MHGGDPAPPPEHPSKAQPGLALEITQQICVQCRRPDGRFRPQRAADSEHLVLCDGCWQFEGGLPELCVTCHLRHGRPRATGSRAVVCGPCWAAHGGKPAAGEIGPMPLVTVPSHDPRDQRHWLRCLRRQDWVRGLRADARGNLLRVARVLACYADWETLDSRPTWDKLVERTGLAERTVARWLQELRVRGWLAHLERGSTPMTRPMPLAHLDGNRAALYGLRIPVTPEQALQIAAESLSNEVEAQLRAVADGRSMAGLGPVHAAAELVAGERPEQGEPSSSDEITGSPPYSPRSLKEARNVSGFSRTRDVVDNFSTNPSPAGRSQSGALRARSDHSEWLDFAVTVPTSEAQMLAAAAWLRRRLPVFAQLTVRGVRAACRPFWAAGWSNLDIVHAMDHRPGVFGQVSGVQIYSDDRVALPFKFIRSRLNAWRRPDKSILPGHHRVKVAQHAARQRIRARHGRAGVRLLRADEQSLSAKRVAEFGRRVAAELQPEQSPRQRTSVPSSSADSRAAAHAALRAAAAQKAAAAQRRRAEHEATMARYAEPIAKARAELAARTRPDPTALSNSADQDLSADERYERALRRARAEGRRGGRRS